MPINGGIEGWQVVYGGKRKRKKSCMACVMLQMILWGQADDADEHFYAAIP